MQLLGRGERSGCGSLENDTNLIHLRIISEWSPMCPRAEIIPLLQKRDSSDEISHLLGEYYFLRHL